MTKTANPFLDRITIYPVKSLDGMDLEQAVVSEGGCLLHDREFALSDLEGNLVIGKTNALVHTLRSRVDFEAGTISLRDERETAWNRFQLFEEKERLHAYLSDHFGMDVLVVRNSTGRLLDIPDLSGATILSTASLEAVTGWFPDLELPQVRRRFRATLEIAEVPAFWEDRLFAGEDQTVEFSVGDVTLLGVSPRARCVVPTRQPETGETTKAFPRTFATHREASLPEGSGLTEYPHAYYLTVNCLIPPTEIGKTLRLGDPVEILGTRPIP